MGGIISHPGYNIGFLYLVCEGYFSIEVSGGRITENAHMQHTAIFHGCKNDDFLLKYFDIFHIFALKHRLWAHVRTASVRAKIRKMYTPVNPSFTLLKRSVWEACFPDGLAALIARQQTNEPCHEKLKFFHPC